MVNQINYATFPANESYAMQQSWRVYFDPKSLKNGESAHIERKHARECYEMLRRFFLSKGLQPIGDSLLNGRIDRLFYKLDDWFEEHPKGSCLLAIISVAALIITYALVFFSTAAIPFITVAVIPTTAITLLGYSLMNCL